MISTDDILKIREIDLGHECRKFIDSEVGRYILDKAIETEDHAKRELINVDPEDAKAIRRLQEDARVPKLLFAWLEEAILKGHNAKESLEGETYE